VAATVLVVDDEVAIREMLADALAAEGYKVVGAADGAEAIAAVARDRPDVVLSDVLMPGLDGPSLIARLRLLGERVPVILMSAYLRQSPLPSVRLVRKPFELDDLLAAIDAALAPGPIST